MTPQIQNNAAQAADQTHIEALRDLQLGVQMDRLNLDDGQAKLDALAAAIDALSKLRAPVADERAAVDPCGYVAVKVSAVDWLKDKFPALTIKAGLCERIGGRLYTITRLMRDHDAALASAPVADEKCKRCGGPGWYTTHTTGYPESIPCSACNPQGVSVERLAKDPFLAAQLWRKPVDADGSPLERILEHVSEYGESMVSSALLSVRSIARRNVETRIAAELAALASAPVAEVKDWRIDTSAGRPILVYKNCSVIEAEDAEYVLRLIAADRASAPVAGEAQRQQRVAYTDSCGHLHWTNGRRILVSLYAAPQASTVAGEAQPFMYGIMGPDGKAHFEEFCVSGDRDELQAEVVDHLNRDNPEDGPYSVVALFRDSTPQASAEPVRILFPAHLRKMWSGGEVQAWLDQHQGVTPPPATTKGSLARYRQWKAEQEQATASCTCPSGDGSLRHPCAAHPAKASGNGGEKWSDS